MAVMAQKFLVCEKLVGSKPDSDSENSVIVFKLTGLVAFL